MLEGLEVSIIEYSKLNFEKRFDPEYFQKEYLRLNAVIEAKPNVRIGDFAFITDGIHTSIDYCEESNINLISAASPQQNTFNLSRQVFISEVAHAKNPRTALKLNDVIISTVGTIGNCAVVDESILPANSDRHVGIIRINKDVSPYYLSTFLLTKYGRFQTLRESTGNVQLNLFIYKIGLLQVPSVSRDFQSLIESTVKNGHKLIEQSKTSYAQAEQTLLEAVRLSPSSPALLPEGEGVNINIKTFAQSFGTSGRLDAEYYQPKYEAMMAKIASQTHARLVDVVKIKKSIEPGSDAYADEGLPFIRVSDFSKHGLTTPDKCLSDAYVQDNHTLLESLKPKAKTVLFSKDGSVGTAYLLREDLHGVTSGAILHLSLKRDDVLPEYLTLVLNSQLVQMQAERDAGGSIILHWRVGEIENVILPIIDLTTQTNISQLVHTSFTLKAQSEHLLNVAKRAVEMAIELDEASAMAWIAEQE
ncbi:MAG: restriction endonuclease subunit S [Methylotenera sp.]|uniref:restriction endonuclease subunit S n=1 Tax=Methylotenera sp. TaxID=2051956 RepID=UPI002720B231|nr:restriction endonuclease subunit S [Methylotenera sp.]MDO9394199.1 restriction endonuclease subunit S [Methylotenera sp.]